MSLPDAGPLRLAALPRRPWVPVLAPPVLGPAARDRETKPGPHRIGRTLQAASALAVRSNFGLN